MSKAVPLQVCRYGWPPRETCRVASRRQLHAQRTSGLAEISLPHTRRSLASPRAPGCPFFGGTAAGPVGSLSIEPSTSLIRRRASASRTSAATKGRFISGCEHPSVPPGCLMSRWTLTSAGNVAATARITRSSSNDQQCRRNVGGGDCERLCAHSFHLLPRAQVLLPPSPQRAAAKAAESRPPPGSRRSPREQGPRPRVSQVCCCPPRRHPARPALPAAL